MRRPQTVASTPPRPDCRAGHRGTTLGSPVAAAGPAMRRLGQRILTSRPKHLSRAKEATQTTTQVGKGGVLEQGDKSNEAIFGELILR